MILNYVTDDRTRKIAISRIEALGGQVILTPQGQQIRLPSAD
jgi:cysteine synthase